MLCKLKLYYNADNEMMSMFTKYLIFNYCYEYFMKRFDKI